MQPPDPMVASKNFEVPWALSFSIFHRSSAPMTTHGWKARKPYILHENHKPNLRPILVTQKTLKTTNLHSKPPDAAIQTLNRRACRRSGGRLSRASFNPRPARRKSQPTNRKEGKTGSACVQAFGLGRFAKITNAGLHTFLPDKPNIEAYIRLPNLGTPR